MVDEELPEPAQEVMHSHIPEDLREVVNRIAQDTEDMDLKLAQFQFVHSMKMVSVAVGGATFMIGILFSLVSTFILFDMFSLSDILSTKARFMIGSITGVFAVIQILAGALLISK